MYVCAQLFISYVCVFSVIYKLCMYVISYVCVCSVIYKLCMYVISYVCMCLVIYKLCMLFIECDANEIKTIIMYLLFLIPRPNFSFLHSAFFLWS